MIAGPWQPARTDIDPPHSIVRLAVQQDGVSETKLADVLDLSRRSPTVRQWMWSTYAHVRGMEMPAESDVAPTKESAMDAADARLTKRGIPLTPTTS